MMNEFKIPVFIFNGFLDSGKTTLIKEIIEKQPNFHNKDTLIISFESGEVEYDQTWLNRLNLSFFEVSDEDIENEYLIYHLIQKFEPRRIVLELNAFVDLEKFKLPKEFVVYQEITLFDCSKFELYYNNMKPLINQMVKYATLVVFNRCDFSANLSKFRRYVKVFNQDAEVGFETEDGKITSILDEDLPYDINKEHIDLLDKDFPIFYMDINEGLDRYLGKTINLNLYVRDVNSLTLVVGRQIMTCCEEDIQFYGFECLTSEKIPNNSLVEIEARIVLHYSHIAKKEVMMLEAIKITKLPYVEEKYLVFA